MAFLYEEELRDKFWEYYNRKGRAKRYQFECKARKGGIDLVTIELYQDNWQINAFEFKLDDMNKVILQAEGNIRYCNKSWIVIPQEKVERFLKDHKQELDELKYVGVIGVERGGKYNVKLVPKFNQNVEFNQKLLNVCMNKL